jgi:hypothetical protein
MAEIDTTGKTIVFDRTPVARLISCAATFGSAGLFFDALARYLSQEPRSILPMLGFALLFLGTLFSALLQYGDHIYVSPQGVLYENRWLPFFGQGRTWLNWEEVIEIREVRRKILILLASDGRRMLVDAIAGYVIARREILRRAPHAVISGTLTREDRP